MTLDTFVARVQSFGAKHYRELPWRFVDDAYAVLVSEVMLQQTQVSRVLTRWPHFMQLFPSLDALAAADVATVLDEWQGLGYNRRALLLKRAAEQCAKRGGVLPQSESELRKLPGIGPATAAGIVAFAYDEPCVYLETNVRTVFLHEFFPDEQAVNDADIVPLVQQTCPRTHVREWYYALLDCGAYLKRSYPNPSRRSAHYTKQSRFEGSRRQKRAELLRIVLAAQCISVDEAHLALDAFEHEHGRESVDEIQFDGLVKALCAEGFLSARDGRLTCAE